MPAQPKKPAAAIGEPAKVKPTLSGRDTDGSTHPTVADSAADDAVMRMTALHLDAHAQTLRALNPPTGLDPAGADEVSALTAALFDAHAETLQKVAARFAAAHEAMLKSLAKNATSDAAADRGDATPAT